MLIYIKYIHTHTHNIIYIYMYYIEHIKRIYANNIHCAQHDTCMIAL